jgi:hypothetical protein
VGGDQSERRAEDVGEQAIVELFEGVRPLDRRVDLGIEVAREDLGVEVGMRVQRARDTLRETGDRDHPQLVRDEKLRVFPLVQESINGVIPLGVIVRVDERVAAADQQQTQPGDRRHPALHK